MILSHYLDALEVSKVAAQAQAIFGGKNPHPQSLVVGGVTCVLDAMNPSRLGDYLFRIKAVNDFVARAYIPDVVLAARYYKGEGLAGIGGGVKNYMSFGGFPLDDSGTNFLFPRGIVKNRNLAKLLPIDEAKITEEVTARLVSGRQAPASLRGDNHSQVHGLRQGRPREGRREIQLVQGAPL